MSLVRIDTVSPVGFVGLGNMGLAMARNILSSGRCVIAWSPVESERLRFGAAGGQTVDNLADMAHVPVVLSMVFDDNAVSSIATGPGGLATILAPGSIHVTMETIAPPLARQLTNTYAAAGKLHLSAPVFGQPEIAAAAQLQLICSGPDAVYEAVEPILKTLGNPRWIGTEPEQALMLKLMGNNMIFVIMELAYEAFSLLAKAGISDRLAQEILMSGLLQSPFIKNYTDWFIANPGKPPPFDVHPIPRKDSKLLVEAAARVGIDLSLVNVVHDKIMAAVAN
jgi:3-hydroxyisobutyrate dehydrogenase-like beta-hydroxyacid dehydrogenase